MSRQFLPGKLEGQERKAHGLRNEMTASRLCSAEQPHRSSQPHRLLASDGVEVPLQCRNHESTKNGREPFYLRGASRCATRGRVKTLESAIDSLQRVFQKGFS